MYAIHTAYVTASPCMTCCKLLLNTSCQRIVYVEEYPHSAAKDLWTGTGRSWEQLLVEL
jgi:deoxycytidylate deaminase